MTLLVLVAGWYRSKGSALGIVLLALLLQVSLFGGSPWRWEVVMAAGGQFWSLLAAQTVGFGVVLYLLGMGVRYLWERLRPGRG